MKIIDGGVTSPKGFFAASTAAGIKYADRNDMAMIVSQASCVTAGTYTKNVVKAAPVIWDRERTDSDTPVRAVVINAGIANACTGEEGMGYCRATAEEAASDIGKNSDMAGDGAITADQVLVASTGVIGMQLPMEKLSAGIAAMSGELSDTREAANRAARAIMTTDTVKKEAAVSVEQTGDPGRVVGRIRLIAPRPQRLSKIQPAQDSISDGICLVSVGDHRVSCCGNAADGVVDDQAGIRHPGRIKGLGFDAVILGNRHKDPIAAVLAAAHDKIGGHSLAAVCAAAQDNAPAGVACCGKGGFQ